MRSGPSSRPPPGSTAPVGSATSAHRADPARQYRRITCRKLSGSSRSPKAVDPVTSQNSTVTVLRFWRGAGTASKAAAHSLQNLASGGFSRPQPAQTLTPARLSPIRWDLAAEEPALPPPVTPLTRSAARSNQAAPTQNQQIWASGRWPADARSAAPSRRQARRSSARAGCHGRSAVHAAARYPGAISIRWDDCAGSCARQPSVKRSRATCSLQSLARQKPVACRSVSTAMACRRTAPNVRRRFTAAFTNTVPSPRRW